MASGPTAFEISESLFNINNDDTYFGPLFEAEFARYGALDLGQTVRKDVGYRTYLFHFILGSILVLPRTRLYDKLSIEDVFFKVESVDSNEPNVIKVFTTFVNNGEKTVHYRVFDFHETMLISDERKLTNQDLEQLSYELLQKGRNLADYTLSSAIHLKIFQPSEGLYEVAEDWKIEGSETTIADHFRAIPSSKSPIVVRQFPISIIQWEKKFPIEVTKSELIDVLDQVFDKLEKLNFPSLEQETDQVKLQLNDLFTGMTKIYQKYDMKYNLRLSASRIDHCGFIHGALSMNLKNFHKVSLNVVNREMNYHDNIQMIIMSNSEDLMEKMTRKPIVVDFKDVDTARATAKATDYVGNKKVWKLPAHIQTLADECIYLAICLTSIQDPVSIIDVKIEPKPNSISSVIIENAEDIFNRYVGVQENNMLYQNHRQNFVETLSYAFDTVQSTNSLTTMDDVRCISRYFMGEAGTSPKIYIGRELEYELDPLIDDLRRHLTTFVIETTIPTLDVVVNFFETRARHPFDSVYDATDDVQMPRTRGTVSHTIVVNVMSWFTDVAFSTKDESASPVKNFLGRKIIVEPIREFSIDPELVEQCIARLPSVDIHDLILNVDEVVLPSPRRSNQLEPFFHECQQLINNPHELMSVVYGIFSTLRTIKQSVKTAVGNRLTGCQVIPLQEKEYPSIKIGGIGSLSKLRVLSFSFLDRPLSLTSGSGMFHNFPTLLARTSNIEIASCNVIFNKRGQKSKKNIVRTVMDYNSNLKNFKRLLKGCTRYDGLVRTKRRGICELQLDSDAKLVDSNMIKPSDFHMNLRTVQKISLITAHGVMIKDMVADIINGDFKGLCLNMGFISGGFAASHLADKVLGLGTRLAGVGSHLGKALMLSSPFIRRATSGLIIYDLINSIQRYKNNDTEAVVDLAEDGVFLSIDAVDIGVEIAEAFGLAEGLSALTGPIGLGVGAAALISGEIYRSIYEVNKLDHIYHLTRWEKFQVGWRKFFHINLDSTIKDIQLDRFDPIETILGMYQGILEKNPNIAMYIGPLLANQSTPTFTELERDNEVYLDKKEAYDGWLDLNTQNRDFSAICRTKSKSRSSKNSVEFYVCENAIGIHRDITKNDNRAVLINLGNGIDISYGMHGYENIFVLGDGYKRIFGGNATNTFILTGNETSGFICGFGRQNTLDFSQFNPRGSVSYFMLKSSLQHSRSDLAKNFSVLKVEGIDSIKGRTNEADALWTSATLSKVDLQGGNRQKYDQIFIEENSTLYNLTINVASYTKITSNAMNGNFIFIYQSNSTNNTVCIQNFSRNASHVFVFDFEYWHISAINIEFENKIRKLNFEFSRIIHGSKISEQNIHVEGSLKNCVFQFRNNFFIYSPDGKTFIGNLITKIYTTSRIIDSFTKILNIWRIPLIVHNSMESSTVVFGAHMHMNSHQKDASTVISNDPEHITHMIGGPGENIYTILGNPYLTSLNPDMLTSSSIVPDVFVHKSRYSNSKSYIIDLRNFYSKLDETEIQLEVSSFEDIFLIHVNDAASVNSIFGLSRVFLKGFTVELLKSQVLVLGSVPMKIQESNSKLIMIPIPLRFAKNETKIVLTRNDVEYNQEIIVDRFLAKYSIFYSNMTDLVITDKFSRSFNDEFSSIVILKDFYVFHKMRTLIVRFSNQVIKLKDKVRFAQNNLVKLESLYSDVWF